MKAAEIREQFLQFFASKDHTVVRSSSLIPSHDPTLMFVNSGMVQFKEVFLGTDKRDYLRAVSVQRCLRAGGKHNDLENVGYTARHHTFFEMLGNFSFGDYSKQKAIHYAWELLVDIFSLPKEKLWVTVYFEDNEAYDIWKNEIGVPAERIIRITDNKGARYASDNFWQMADTGPCGPSSEIFYDHGPSIPGGPPGSAAEDGDRFIEIWNLVFMQFERSADGVMTALPKPCVDTGMGLERIAAILQGVQSNYDIDLFQNLIQAAARVTATDNHRHNSLKVIADHIRASAFMMLDGVLPGNEGRAYVLRRIIRRAVRHGYKLGCRNPFFHLLINDLVAQMGQAYPELQIAQQRIEQALCFEETRFFETLTQGIAMLDQEIDAMHVNYQKNNGDKNLNVSLISNQKSLLFSGEIAFKLHDTFGFPLDLTADVCRERGIKVDEDAFNLAMAKQRAQARAAGKFKKINELNYSGSETQFIGYADLKTEQTTILAIYQNDQIVNTISPGANAMIILDRTPFYAESGGQIGDQGIIFSDSSYFQVHDVIKVQANVFGHIGMLDEGQLTVGDKVNAQVNENHRIDVARNHSATHLLHSALRQVLGTHVQQRGSLVNAERTRFDFAHFQPLTRLEWQKIEILVNQEILKNSPAVISLMQYEDAVESGAMALFGEKYSDQVRVLQLGVSKELCGGTHVVRTGDIGFFKIISESGVAAGVRRIEAITGNNAIHWLQNQENQLFQLSHILKVNAEQMPQRVSQLIEQNKWFEKKMFDIKMQDAFKKAENLLKQAHQIKNIKVLLATMDIEDSTYLREIASHLKAQLGISLVMLTSSGKASGSLIAAVSQPIHHLFKANDLVKMMTVKIGGKGGGRADLAQAGGVDVNKVNMAYEDLYEYINNKLQEISKI